MPAGQGTKPQKTNSLRNYTSGGDNSIQRNFGDYLLLHAATPTFSVWAKWVSRWVFPRFPVFPGFLFGLAWPRLVLAWPVLSPWCFAVGVIKCFVAQNSALELIILFINTFFLPRFAPVSFGSGFYYFSFCFSGKGV